MLPLLPALLARARLCFCFAASSPLSPLLAAFFLRASLVLPRIEMLVERFAPAFIAAARPASIAMLVDNPACVEEHLQALGVNNILTTDEHARPEVHLGSRIFDFAFAAG